MPLIVTPNIDNPDSFYEELINSQRDCAEDEAARVIARLVLLLANHVGDRRILSEAIRMARGNEKK